MPALIGVDAPPPVRRREVLRLEHDRQVRLDLALDDAEPAEVRLVVRDVEELAVVADGDVPAATRVRVDVRPLALPEVPLGDDAAAAELEQVLVRELAGRGGDSREVVARAGHVTVVGARGVVAIIRPRRPAAAVLLLELRHLHVHIAQVPEPAVEVHRETLDVALASVGIAEDGVRGVVGAEEHDRRAVLARPRGGHPAPIDAVDLEGLDDAPRAPVDVELDELVLAALLVEEDPDHRSDAVLVGQDDHAVRVPRQGGDLRTDAEVVVDAADLLAAVAERREEPEEFVGAHAEAVVGDGSPIHAEVLDRLPLDAELDLLGPGLDGVLEELARPLERAAGLEHAVDEVGSAGDAYLHVSTLCISRRVSSADLTQKITHAPHPIGGSPRECRTSRRARMRRAVVPAVLAPLPFAHRVVEDRPPLGTRHGMTLSLPRDTEAAVGPAIFGARATEIGTPGIAGMLARTTDKFVPGLAASGTAAVFFLARGDVLVFASQTARPMTVEVDPTTVVVEGDSVRVMLPGLQLGIPARGLPWRDVMRAARQRRPSATIGCMALVGSDDAWRPWPVPAPEGALVAYPAHDAIRVDSLDRTLSSELAVAACALAVRQPADQPHPLLIVDEPVWVRDRLAHAVAIPLPDPDVAEALDRLTSSAAGPAVSSGAGRKSCSCSAAFRSDDGQLGPARPAFLVARDRRLYLALDGRIITIRREDVAAVALAPTLALAVGPTIGVRIDGPRVGELFDQVPDLGWLSRTTITCEVEVDGRRYLAHVAGREGSLEFLRGALDLSEVRALHGDAVAELAVTTTTGSQLTVRSSGATLRALGDLVAEKARIAPRIFKEDFRHPAEADSAAVVRSYEQWIDPEAVSRFFEKRIEPMSVPDMRGKAVRVTSRQFASVHRSIRSIADVLSIEPPDAFVFDGPLITVDAEGLRRPRLEITRRAVSELAGPELDQMLARELAHIALGHLELEVFGEQMFTLLRPALGAIEGGGAGAVGAAAGVAGNLVLPIIGGQVASAAARLGAKALSRKLGVFDARGELMLAKVRLAAWFRHATLSADAFGALYVGDVRASLRSVLLGIFNHRQMTAEVFMPEYLGELDRILGIDGVVAMYTRLDEVLPYGQARVAALLGYLAGRRGRNAWSKMRRIRGDEVAP
jgi:hypothetical protein